MSEKAAPGCAPGACSCTGPEECWRKGAMTAPSVSERLRELRSCGNHPCDCWQCSSIEALATEIEARAETLRTVERVGGEKGVNTHIRVGKDARTVIVSVADALAPQKEGT